MKIFKFFLFSFFLLFCLNVFGQPHFSYSLSGAHIRGIYRVTWEESNPPSPPYTLEISIDGGSTWDFLCSGSNTYFNFNTEGKPNGPAMLRIIDHEGGSDQVNITIDNTPPDSDIRIFGTVRVGSTISYTGSWSDNLSGPVIVKEAWLYGDTDTDTSNAVKIKDLTISETPVVNNDGSYSGSFTLTSDLNIGQYNYLFVKVVVEDQAKDDLGNGNRTTDWSNSLQVPHITGITITSPTQDAKCRDTIKIKWEPSGTTNGDENYQVSISGTIIYEGTATETTWDTNSFPDGRYTIKVYETGSGIEDTCDIIVDNIPPTISLVNISPELDDGIIPDTEKGNNGRHVIWIKKSGWYKTNPTLNLRISDPVASDGSCAGIKAVAYRFVVDSNGQEWQIRTYSGEQSVDLSITVNVEGKSVYVEVIAVDDAQTSITDPQIPILGYNGNYSNYSTKDDFTIKVDTTPPQILGLRIDKLPDGPIINNIHWYKSAPIVNVIADDNLSGVLEGVVAFTVDESNIDDFKFPSLTEDTGVYTLDILDTDRNGEVERVVFKKYLQSIGIEREYPIYFPIFNSYGKKIKVRVWDKAGNISEQYVGNPWYIEEDTQGNIIREEQISLYVDTVPPDTTAEPTGTYMPKQFKDIGTYERSYTDKWRHNKNFPRPEDCPPPSNYPNDYVDYIYYASMNNRFLNPLSITLNAVDSLYEIFELTDLTELDTELNKRPFTILPGNPDYDPRYDFFFSDFTSDNLGSGVLSDLTGIQYRISYDSENVLVDLRQVKKIGGKYYAVGEKGVILESSDGVKWNVMSFDDTSNLYGIYGTSEDNIWACGENGRVIKYDGVSWGRIDIGIDWFGLGFSPLNLPALYGIYVNGNEIWVVGTGGTILYSSTGGTSWITQDSGVSVNLYGIWGNGSNIYVVGASGTILKYDGSSWTKDTPPVTGDLYSIWGDESDIYIFGDIEVLSKIGYLKYNYNDSRWDLNSTNIPSIKNNKRRLPIYSINGDDSKIYVSGRNGTVLQFDSSWSDISPTGVRETIYGVFSELVDSDTNLVIVGGSGLTGKGITDGWQISNKWEQWKNYLEGYITLPSGTTSIEYFAIDNIGNEENHHKIVDPGRGIRKIVYDGKGTGNLRSDDSVPDPDLVITSSTGKNSLGWYKEQVKLQIIYNNENDWLDPLPTGEIGSGIKKFQFALVKDPKEADFIDYVADKQAPKEITLVDGIYYLSYRAVDNLENKSGDQFKPYLVYEENPVKIDTTKPITSITPTGQGTYQLNASDSLSGVQKILYKFSQPVPEDEYGGENGDVNEYTEPFTVPGGTTKVYYWSIDNAGNSDFYNVYIVGAEDTVKPQSTLEHVSGSIYPDISASKIYVTSESNENILNRTKFRLSAIDNPGGTGVKDIRYKFDTEPDQQNIYTDGVSYYDTGDFDIPEGTTKIYYWAIDGANNVEVPKSKDIVVDDDAPQITIILSPSQPSQTGWYNKETGSPEMTIQTDEPNTPNDTQSGLKEIRYDLTGSQTPANLYTSPVTLPDGEHNIVVMAVDNLNNAETVPYGIVKVDTKEPGISVSRTGRNVTIDVNDPVPSSGIDSIYYFTTNDANKIPTDADWTQILTGNSITFLLPEGHNKVWYKAKDKAGNETNPDSKVFVAEMEPPVSSISIKGSPISDKVKTGDTVIIEGTWSDANGPVVVLSVRLLDQGDNLIQDLNLLVNPITVQGTTSGTYSGSFEVPTVPQSVTGLKLEVTVRDNVSSEDYLCNRTTIVSNTLTVDNQYPVINIKATLTGRTPSRVNNIWWYKDAVPIEIDIEDTGTGIEEAEYSLDGGNTWYQVIDNRGILGKKNFDLENSCTKIKVKAKDKVGNEVEVEGITEFVDGTDYYNGLIYVDTYAPKVTIKITNGKIWPPVPPANTDLDNPELPLPETLLLPPGAYPQEWIDYIFINSSSNSNGGTKFRLIADDTPPSSETSDGKASCGLNILGSIPNYRISTSLEVLDSEDKWGSWLNPTINYQDKDGDGYYEYSETIYEFTLPSGTTSIWYYAQDNLENKEEHKIVEREEYHPENSQQEIGSGNLRTDDNVPDPDIEITPSSPDGNNGWYKSGVSIEFKYNEPNNYNDPLPTGEIGSGFKKFQYVIKPSPTTPNESEYNDYNLGTKINISVEGTYYVFCRAVDNIGNTSLISSSLKVDGTKPNVSLTLSNGIFNLNASDAGSGVEKVYYKFILYDNTEILNEMTGSSATFTTPNGINKIECWAIDYAGNESDHGIYNISTFDTTPPITTITYSQPYYLSGTTLYVTSGDNTASTIGKTAFTISSIDPKVNNFASGVSSGFPKYRIENSLTEWTTYSGQFNVSSSDGKIEAYAIDGAGNTGNTVSLNFVVDDNAPEITKVDFDKGPDTNNWYNSNTGKPNIVIESSDDGSGIYEVKYSFDGVNYTKYTNPISVSEGKDLNLTLYISAADNLGNTRTTIVNLTTINVDITRPVSSIQILSGRKFKITSSDNVSGIKKIWYQFDNNTPSSFDFTSSSLSVETEEIDTPVETKQIKYWAEDFAGNVESYKIHDIKQIKISGYVKDYSGNPVKNVTVVLTGEANRTTTTDLYGYYEFSDLSSIGIYYIIPAVHVALPQIRAYDGTASSDITDQNFIITNGWRFKEYDMGNSNDYYFKSSTILPSYSQLILDWSTGIGGNILTGDLDYDGKLELIIKKDYTGVVYNYNKNTGYTQKGTISTNYNLGLIDSIDIDTQLEIILTGIGQNLLEIYDKDMNKIGSFSYSGTPLPPDNTTWGVRFAENKILFAGYGINSDGSIYTNIMLYDYEENEVEWTKDVPQKIEVDKLNLCIRDDYKLIAVFGGVNDTSDLNVYALDLLKGNLLWTKTLTNQKGRIITLVSSVYGGSSQDIIGIRTSTQANQVPLTIYRFDSKTGNILTQSSIGAYTYDIKYALSDIDNDGVKELLISDSNENLYLIDMTQFVLEKQGIGKVWACVDFDGKTGKEIIVSYGTYVKVLDSNLNEIMSYNLNDNIKKVIVSDVNNDGIIEIIVTSPTKTYILRPTTTLDLPNAPTNLRCELGVNSIYIYWNYVPGTGTLTGFKIYRSTTPSNWGSPVQIINDPNARTATDTPPSVGMWYYKVSAFNDYGEVDCINPASYLIEYRETVPQEEGGGCFIATACFGENSWQVKLLKEFRDKVLLKSEMGKKFVKFYYKHSPYVKEYIKDKVILKTFVKIALYPFILFAYFILHYFVFVCLISVLFFILYWRKTAKL